MISLHRAHVDRFLERVIPTTPGLVGLHVGSGPGPRGRYLPPAGQRWIDLDLTCGDVQGDIRALPFRDGSFDVLRCTEMIYCVAAVDKALTECRRVLRPGGKLVLTAPLLVPPINEQDVVRLTRTGWQALLPDAEIVPLGGYWSHLVITLEHLSPMFALLRPLAWLDDGTYPHAYGLTVTA